MFTGQTLRLSSLEATTAFKFKVVRDCDISYVGKVPSRIEPRLVPCTTQEHIFDALTEPGIAGIVTTPDLENSVPSRFGLAVSPEPLRSAYLIHAELVARKDFQWIHFPSRIAKTARVHPSSVISENDVVIEENCVVHPNVVIFPRTIIGEGSTIGAGTIVGCDGFEVDTTTSPYRILPQAGGVRIGRNVDIQAKCTIVRSTFGGFTEIGDESKFDCQVHLAHDCRVGKRVRITACSEISGRVDIGDGAYLGPNVSISNGVHIGEQSHITIGSVVTRNVPAGGHVSGNFAIDHAKWLNLMRKIR